MRQYISHKGWYVEDGFLYIHRNLRKSLKGVNLNITSLCGIPVTSIIGPNKKGIEMIVITMNVKDYSYNFVVNKLCHMINNALTEQLKMYEKNKN